MYFDITLALINKIYNFVKNYIKLFIILMLLKIAYYIDLKIKNNNSLNCS